MMNMTYNELKRKYMLHEITKEEYEKGKNDLIHRLFEMYEECKVNENVLEDRLEILKK